MKILKNLFIVGLTICIFSSCKKDKTFEVNKTQLLTAGNWRIIGATSTVIATGVTTDTYAGLRACEKDNEFRFTASGVHEYLEGATKCNAADPQVIYLYSWRFLNNETVVEISAGTSRLEYKIITLTESQLVFEASNASIRDQIRLIR